MADWSGTANGTKVTAAEFGGITSPFKTADGPHATWQGNVFDMTAIGFGSGTATYAQQLFTSTAGSGKNTFPTVGGKTTFPSAP